MTRTRLIVAATLASCGLFLAMPAAGAVPVPVASSAADTFDSDTASEQYAKRDKDRRRIRKHDRDRSRDRSRPRGRDRDRGYYRDRDRRYYSDRERYRRYRRDHDRGRFRWDYDRREHWRTQRHPRYRYWRGRRLPPRGRFLVIANYWDYYLPAPPYGHYYVREGNDVFLVLEATRLIVDSFILLELLGR